MGTDGRKDAGLELFLNEGRKKDGGRGGVWRSSWMWVGGVVCRCVGEGTEGYGMGMMGLLCEMGFTANSRKYGNQLLEFTC